MPRILLKASCVLACLFASQSLCAVDYPASPYTVVERYPGNLTTLTIALPTTSNANGAQNLSGHSIIGNPGKGVLNSSVGTPLTYTPTQYLDGNDTFNWQALNDVTGLIEQYTAKITISPVNNPPVV